jgi:Ca2+-binding RTX toxin-like protein
MSSIIITEDKTYDGDTLDPNTDFDFSNLAGTTVTATFNFLATSPIPFYVITGSAGVNRLVLNSVRFFDFVSLEFNSWTNRDKVTINGSNGDDEITDGTSQRDLINGRGGADTLRAEEEGDTLLGGSGDDRVTTFVLGVALDGGTGNDLLVINLFDPLLDAVNINLSDGGGGREVRDGLTLRGFERIQVTLTWNDDTIIGGSLGDWIDGDDRHDSIDGFGGNDTLYGSLGDDTVKGGLGNDLVYGGDGNDSLSGGDGRDALLGGLGRDAMTGGAGADRFIFLQAESTEVLGAELITDFEQGRDKLDFSRVDADPSTPTYDPVDAVFIGETIPVPDMGFQIYFEQTATETIVFAGGMQIRLTGVYDLTRDDFIL